MLFNTLDYGIFLPIVFLLYWFFFPKSLKGQNILLLAASYYFYSCWNWRFLFLLAFSTLLDFYTGIKISESENSRTKKIWLYISIVTNLGLLCVFKYFNFFIASFIEMFNVFGWHLNPFTLNIILPVGISFYTFHGLSYILDIYKGRIKVERNIVDYSLFVSFFPLLVAGPIERATHLLPQIKKERKFSYDKAKDGIYQIIWGLFKKIVIADSCADYVNSIFSNYQTLDSLTLAIGAAYFVFQLYGDFGGYSDIALGTAKLLGFDLLRNFNYPFFSRNMGEFWTRWHISLTSWLRDYIFLPLTRKKRGKLLNIRNTFIVFIISGFWHGANWTFISFGVLQGIWFLPRLITQKSHSYIGIVAKDRSLPTLRELGNMLGVFCINCFSVVFFRSLSIKDAVLYLKGIFTFNFSGSIKFLRIDKYCIELIPLIILFIVIEWHCRRQEHPFWGKWLGFKLVFIILLILVLGVYSNSEDFIYFQF